MSNEELIKRYVYAVTELLPKDCRDDVEKELTSSIDEMLEARCGEITPTEQDVRVVLAELGTPEELAQKYDTDSVGHLIGGIYYMKYKRVMKYALLATAIGMALAAAVGITFENGGKSIFEGIGEWIGRIFDCVLCAFAVVTTAFAILERKKVSLSGTSVDTLPKVPEKKDKISAADCVIEIILTVFCTAFVLWLGGYITIGHVGDTTDFKAIALFNTEAVRGVWILPVLWAAATVVCETVKLITGRYNLAVMITTIATNAVIIVCSSIFLLSSGVFNTEWLVELAHSLPADSHEVIVPLFENIGAFIFLCVVLGCLSDVIKSTVRTIKSKG